MKYSIVIPTLNHLDDALKPCIESLMANTDISNNNMEVIIVCNGCTDGTQEYLQSVQPHFSNLIVLEYPKSLGYTVATNIGMKQADGDYIICLNNDVEIIGSEWLELLETPFKIDPEIGITGCHSLVCPHANREFLLFFCVMIKREVIDNIGILDECFSPGYGEDTDYSCRAVDYGYKIKNVADDTKKLINDFWHSAFPMHHRGEGTVHDNTSWVWNEVIDRNSTILRYKYNNGDVTSLGCKLNPDKQYTIILPVTSATTYLTESLCALLEHTDLTDNVKLHIVYVQCCKDACKIVQSMVDKYKCDITCSSTEYPLSFIEVINTVISSTDSDYYIILDENACLLSDKKNQWLEYLYAPFVTNSNARITGPELNHYIPLDSNYIDPSCMMVSSDVVKNGLFDETYGKWDSLHADADLGRRMSDEGYELVKVPIGSGKNNHFPIYYAGHDPYRLKYGILATTYLLDKYKELTPKKRELVVMDRSVKNVTAVVCTKDRYDTTLSHTLLAIAQQTYLPKELLIFDDSDKKRDLRDTSTYNHVFNILTDSGIEWKVVHTEGVGQVQNHNASLDISSCGCIWRLDDDTVPEPDVLEQLIDTFSKDTSASAVGGLVLDATSDYKCNSLLASNKIEDIYRGMNEQWFKQGDEVKSVDHLYSSFLYSVDEAKKIGGYCTDLSRIGHREETIFTYGMKHAGYNVLINPNAITWHLDNPTGGVRDLQNDMRMKDEHIFTTKLKEWGVTPKNNKIIVLDSGLGDHYCFKNILNEIKEKHRYNTDIIISCCYNEVFYDVDGVILVSIREMKRMIGDIGRYNIYHYCDTKKWASKSLVHAFREMYL